MGGLAYVNGSDLIKFELNLHKNLLDPITYIFRPKFVLHILH